MGFEAKGSSSIATSEIASKTEAFLDDYREDIPVSVMNNLDELNGEIDGAAIKLQERIDELEAEVEELKAELEEKE